MLILPNVLPFAQLPNSSLRIALGLLVLILLIGFFPSTDAIQCYSGNQFSIVECPSLYCIKQTLGLDTVRYCDGTGFSSICSTYRIIDSCQTVPSLGYVCCCPDQLCNSAQKVPMNALFGITLLGIALASLNVAMRTTERMF